MLGNMANKKWRRAAISHVCNFFVITAGSAVYAFAVSVLLEPRRIVPGGIAGLSMVVCDIFPVLPLGAVIIAFNVPLFILAWRFLGHSFLLRTVYGTVAASAAIELFGGMLARGVIPPIDTEPLLAGIFGGLLMGCGLGLVFIRGATTGGSDIIARLLKLVFPGTQLGKLLLAFDGVVVTLSGVVFGSVNAALFAAVALYVSARALDGILYGMNIERVAYIVTGRPVEIARAIGEKMQRGATLLHGEGAFSGNPKKLILCAIKRQQITALKSLVMEMDPGAFLILSEANEIYGEGFGSIRNV